MKDLDVYPPSPILCPFCPLSSSSRVKKVDDRLAQLTRMNETVVCQLQELVASRSSPQETARRAGGMPLEACSSVGVAGVESGGQNKGEEMDKSAPLHADMQRLMAEVREEDGWTGRGVNEGE